jgi:hypothetical protein
MLRSHFSASAALVAALSTSIFPPSMVAGQDERIEGIERYELRVDENGWGGGSKADVEAVLRSAFDEVARHLANKLPEPIRVKRDGSGPIVHFQRNPQGEIVMLLSTKDTYWAQYAYQGAHEFCHILCGFREGDKANLWFEESLCEMASIFAVKGMAERWKTHAPYPNWRDFSQALAIYAADIEKKYAVPKEDGLAAYYREHAEALAENPTDREQNGRVAVWLLPLFEKNPENWRALAFLNGKKGPEKRTFREYLADWKRNCPDACKGLVDEIERRFLEER